MIIICQNIILIRELFFKSFGSKNNNSNKKINSNSLLRIWQWWVNCLLKWIKANKYNKKKNVN